MSEPRFHGLSKKELIDILRADRDLHFQHPQLVNRTVLIAVGTGAVGLLGVAIKSKVSGYFWLSVVGLAVAMVVIGWGLKMHSALHGERRVALEDALSGLLACESSEEIESLLGCLLERFPAGGDRGPLLAVEPDRSRLTQHHDFKIVLGVAFIVLDVVVSIAYFWNS